MVVYLLECVTTGKRYVGKTVQTSHARWREHRTEARIGRKDTPLLRAIREHGPEAFTVTDLCTVDSQDKLASKERRYIREFKTDDPDKGYNVLSGGGGKRPKKRFPRDPLQASHKEKISESVAAYWKTKKGVIDCRV